MHKKTLELFAALKRNSILKPFLKAAFIYYKKSGLDIRHTHIASFHSEAWKEYCRANGNKIGELMDGLKSGMDESSRELADRVYLANVEITPSLKYSNMLRYPAALLDKNYDPALHFDVIASKFPYKIPYEAGTSLNTAWYRCGLDDTDETKARLNGSVIIDLGAFFGDSALILSEYSPSKIYAFEPQKDNFELMRETIRANGKENVIEPVQLAAYKKDGHLTIFGEGQNASIIPDDTKKQTLKEEIPCVSIDSFIDKLNRPKVGFIKMDIEGGEYDAIDGAIETIKRDRPIMNISVYHRAKDFFEIKPMIEKLNLGYEFSLKKCFSGSGTYEIMLICR